jgi:Domain of unknown function (DUF4276)
MEGPDQQVCEHLLQRLIDKHNVACNYVSIGMSNKGDLLRDCGNAARILLDEEHCDKVVVVWDLIPPDSGACRKEERDQIIASLTAAGVTRNYELVCIMRELEAWLLSDERAINTYLSKPTRAVNISRVRNPERVANPKNRISQIFKTEARNRLYNDQVDAIEIVKKYPDLNRIKKCPTFQRFANKTLAVTEI